MNKQTITKYSLLLGLVLFLVFAKHFYVSGWNNPSATAPSSNLPSPINMSTANQDIDATLTLGSVRAGVNASSSFVSKADGSIGVGLGFTTAKFCLSCIPVYTMPAQALEVNGPIRGNLVASTTSEPVCADTDGKIVLCTSSGGSGALGSSIKRGGFMVFTSSGTFTPTSSMKNFRVQVWGGGGEGAYCTEDSSGSPNKNPGTNGGTTSFTDSSHTGYDLYAYGGKGATTSNGGSGGSGSTSNGSSGTSSGVGGDGATGTKANSDGGAGGVKVVNNGTSSIDIGDTESYLPDFNVGYKVAGMYPAPSGKGSIPGGGGGGWQGYFCSSAGGGGGGGGYTEKSFSTLPSDTFTITVGVGGKTANAAQKATYNYGKTKWEGTDTNGDPIGNGDASDFDASNVGGSGMVIVSWDPS